MYRLGLGALALSLLLCSPPLAVAHDGGCISADCPDEAAVELVRDRIAGTCDCAAAAKPARHMRCVRGVIASAVKEGALTRACKRLVKHCEAELGCGRGIRPFRAVQQVFKGSCALPSCHSTIAREGALVLESEELSYAALVGQPSAHPEAAGMLRVKPGDPRGSFLIQKLRGRGPGDPMPQGTRPLSKGTIKVVEKWIKRGALATAEECAPANGQARRGRKRVCNDRPLRAGNYIWRPLPPLEAPAPGAGMQLYVPPRAVEPGTEWETCYAFRPNWDEIAVANGLENKRLLAIRQQIYRMHEGSHHLLLYAYRGSNPDGWKVGEFFPCFAAQCENPGDCPSDTGENLLPIGGTQVAGTRYEVNYPNGVGIPILLLSAETVLIANLHYTNPFQPPQPIYGEAWLNLNFYAPGEWKVLLDGIFAVNAPDMFVEPYQTRTISRIWRPRSILGGRRIDGAVFQLFGHMHKRGHLFQIDYVKGGQCSASGALCGRDDDCACRVFETDCIPGQTCLRGPDAEDTTIYYTTSWDHAPVVDFPPPYFRVAQNEGLRWTCTHTNGVAGDPTRPPKVCHEGCESCGWDAATRTCVFERGVRFRFHQPPARVYQEGEPMPLVFGELADDDMCNMFGYQVDQADLARLE